MEGRELIIVAQIKIDGELEQNQVIQKINIIIDFINKYRYRLPAEKDQEYKQKNPQADMRKDVELREKIARDLSSQANVMGIYQQVEEALKQRYSQEAERERHFANFKLVANDFFKHIQFAHLTAVELAIVGMMIDTLLILLYQAHHNLQDDEAQIGVVNKQNELLRIRESLAACMAYHKAIFEHNCAANDKKEFNYSDIVINLFEAIEKGTGIRLAEERRDLWPDMSYLLTLPEIPFYKLDEPKTVARYFDDFRSSLPPGIDDVDQLTDDIRAELSLLDEEEKVASASQPVQVEEAPTSAGCFSGWSFWSRAQTTVQAAQPLKPLVVSAGDWVDLDSGEEGATLEESEVENYALDDVIRLMSSFNKKAQDQLEKMDLEQSLRKELYDLQQALLSEIGKLQELGCFSCFSFFWIGTLRKKLHKEAALNYVLGASTLEELGQRANDKLTDDGKDMVCAGWHSRTEAALKHVNDVVQFQSASHFRFDLL